MTPGSTHGFPMEAAKATEGQISLWSSGPSTAGLHRLRFLSSEGRLPSDSCPGSLQLGWNAHVACLAI